MNDEYDADKEKIEFEFDADKDIIYFVLIRRK